MPYGQIQYQVHTEPVSIQPETVTESRWHQPWSEPRRGKRWPLMAASGWFGTLGAGTAEVIFEDKWHQPWSEPIVKVKLGLRTGSQQTLAFQFPHVSFSWMKDLSEPKRFKKGLAPHLHPTTVMDPIFTFNPSLSINGWYTWLSEPKRFKQGLAVQFQREYWAPPRALPTPNVTAVMSAFEVNTDTALMAINVVGSVPPGSLIAKVALTEMIAGSATSVIESS